MLKTILFDLDGTLLDTEPDFSICLNQLLQKYEQPLIAPMLIRKTISNGARALIKLGFNVNEQHEKFNDYLNEFLTLYLAQIKHSQCSLFEGIEELVDWIDKNSMQWGIVTNKPNIYTSILVERTPILQKASQIICPDHITLAKPDPEGLLLACRKTPCQPKQAIYVGDHPRDIDAGIQAKMSTIAAKWGYLTNEKEIEEWGADKVVEHPTQIIDYLKTYLATSSEL